MNVITFWYLTWFKNVIECDSPLFINFSCQTVLKPIQEELTFVREIHIPKKKLSGTCSDKSGLTIRVSFEPSLIKSSWIKHNNLCTNVLLLPWRPNTPGNAGDAAVQCVFSYPAHIKIVLLETSEAGSSLFYRSFIRVLEIKFKSVQKQVILVKNKVNLVGPVERTTRRL